MNHSLDLDRLADVLAERIADRLFGRLDSDALLDVHGAALLLNCSVPTIERMVSRGELPSLKIGALRRFKRGELLAYVTSQSSRIGTIDSQEVLR